jgi:hypothetical protein
VKKYLSADYTDFADLLFDFSPRLFALALKTQEASDE